MRFIHWPDWALLTLAFAVLGFAASTSSASAHTCSARTHDVAGSRSQPAPRMAEVCARIATLANWRTP